MLKIIEDTNYRNITTDEIVTVNDLSYSNQLECRVVDYFNKLKNRSFIKPCYVFIQTYTEAK